MSSYLPVCHLHLLLKFKFKFKFFSGARTKINRTTVLRTQMFGFISSNFRLFWPCVCACFKFCSVCPALCLLSEQLAHLCCLLRSWLACGAARPQKPPRRQPGNYPETTQKTIQKPPTHAHTQQEAATHFSCQQNAHQICIILRKVTFCTNRANHILCLHHSPRHNPHQ